MIQGWASSRWRKDDYRNVAAGFWRLMGAKVPDLISKVRTHLSKSQAQKIGLCEERRRGNEVVDNIARGVAERHYQD